MSSPSPVTAATRIEAPIARVFAILCRYDQVLRAIDGLDSLTPLSEATTTPGARFRAVFRIPGRQLTTEVLLAEVVPDRRVLWRAADAVNRSVLFETKEIEPALTAVRLSVTYDRPGGIGGVLLGPVIDETVKSRARASLEHLSRLSASE